MSAFSELLQAHARSGGERAALVDARGTLTQHALIEAIGQRGEELSALGVVAGTRLCLVPSTQHSAAITLLAATALEAATMLIDPASPPAERRRLAERFGGEFLLSEGEPEAVNAPPPAASICGRAPALGLATSGVSGDPKVVQRDWLAVAANAAAFSDAIGLDADDVVLCTTPLHHSYGLCAGLVSALTAGATIVLPRSPPTPAVFRQYANENAATVVLSVPLLLSWYADGPALERRPRLVMSAGERLPREVAESWLRRQRVPVYEHYGTSESGMIAVDVEGIPGSVGRPIAGVDIRLVPLEDQPGEAEIAVCSGTPPVLLSVRNGARADEPGEGWQRPGDIARMDDVGRLYLLGRRGATLNVGGKKVAAQEVEDAVSRVTGGCASAVVAAAPPGEALRVCLFVERPPMSTTELRRRLAAELAAFEVPSVIRAVAELPRTGSGKVRRATLLDELARERGA